VGGVYVSSIVLSRSTLKRQEQANLKDQRTGVSVSPATPRARLTPTCPSTDSGCNDIPCAVPPTRTFAPAPTPTEISPLAPTKRPVSTPGRTAPVLPITPHAITPPAVKPISRPMRFILPKGWHQWCLTALKSKALIGRCSAP